MNNLIDDIMHRLFIASFNYSSDEERRRKRNSVDSINWYIMTGRASTPWIKALAKVNSNTLLNRLSKNSQSTDECIDTTTAYLKRYCDYKI